MAKYWIKNVVVEMLLAIVFLSMASCTFFPIVDNRDAMVEVDEAHRADLNGLGVKFGESCAVLFVTTNDCCRCVRCYSRLRMISKAVTPIWFKYHIDGEIVFISNQDNSVHVVVSDKHGMLMAVNTDN